MSGFTLTKWYLDCLTAAGDVSICYSGLANWGPLQLHYSSLLQTTGSHIAVRQSLREQPEPQLRDGTIYWDNPALNIRGEWRRPNDEGPHHELHQQIFRSDEGSIDWHCLLPCGPARVGEHSGLGYVERLTMTVPPWRLPLQTLRWGRFTSPSHSVVWIDCLGQLSRRIVYVNGVEVAAPIMEDALLRFADGSQLAMDRSLVLRQGPLGNTVLRGISRKVLPLRILRVNECKWRSRACFTPPRGPAVEGWAIHERVDWPQ